MSPRKQIGIANLLWSDENEYVYCCCEGTTKEEFIEQVKVEAEIYEVKLPEKLLPKIEAMISADKTIYADQIMPLSGCGVVIEDYWVLEIA